jgi:hypothetical protein
MDQQLLQAAHMIESQVNDVLSFFRSDIDIFLHEKSIVSRIKVDLTIFLV